MELKYLGVPPEALEAGSSEDIEPIYSWRKEFRQKLTSWKSYCLNDPLRMFMDQARSTPSEKKASFLVFIIFLVCFIYTVYSVFTLNNSCFSYEAARRSLIAERDALLAERDTLTRLHTPTL